MSGVQASGERASRGWGREVNLKRKHPGNFRRKREGKDPGLFRVDLEPHMPELKGLTEGVQQCRGD